MFQRLKQGLIRTKQAFVNKVEAVVRRSPAIGEEFFEELEETFILSDMGPRTASELVEQIRERVRENKARETDAVLDIVRAVLSEALTATDSQPALFAPSLTVVMMTGVNGSGKTTSTGKLAAHFKSEGKSVMLAACDTFRAAASDQLEIWSKRAEVPIVRLKEGADPSAVMFDAVSAAIARKTDILLADTAGRLHTKVNLMEELKKVHRTAMKAQAPVLRNWLVLDATLGQNALSQVRLFHEAVPVDALVLTKMDGTAKGGIVFSIINELKIPIAFVGVGEKIEDLMPFNAAEFAQALLGKNDEEQEPANETMA